MSSCVSCPNNTYSLAGSDNITDCICNAGFEGSTNGEACTPCAMGTYKALNGSGMCMHCEAGTWQNETAASVCSECPAHTNSPMGSDHITDCICDIGTEGSDGMACSACEAGTFKATNGSGMCMHCAAGDYLNMTMGTGCLMCPHNTNSPMGSDDITDCICNPGFEGMDGMACSACEAGTFKAMNGSGMCMHCAAGTYLNITNGTECLTCPANTNSPMGSDDITDCICNPGFEGMDGMACSACAAGEFKAMNGSGMCMHCEAGTWQNETAASVCSECPSNTISLMGSDHITDCICDIGTEGSDGQACMPCAEGTFKGVNGSGVCTNCAVGTYLNITDGSACLTCPHNTNSLLGSDDITDCICNAGFEGSDGKVCSPCEAGTFKAMNGSGMCMHCAAGTYLNMSTGTVCRECPANTISLMGSDDISDCICNPGFEGMDGMACSACAAGEFKAMNGSGMCMHCEAGTWQNETGASVCSSCPSNTNSPVGSDHITDCICNAGTEGSDGATCSPCALGTFKAMNGSGMCTNCAAGTYLNMTMGTVCRMCPANTNSLTRSGDVTDCICNIGYGGPDGGVCSECAIGTFKGVNGSGPCTNCPSGTFLGVTAGSVCDSCPSNTVTRPGAVEIVDCKCAPGFTGSDGGLSGDVCTACEVGTFKGINGSSPCVNCQADTYQNFTGRSACQACPAGAVSFERSDELTDCICNVGYAGQDGGPCSACDPGTFKRLNGSALCLDCGVKTYQDLSAASSCVDCPSANSYSFPGSQSVQECLCNVGYDGNGATCTACAAGKFKGVNGSTPCRFCQPGTYLNATAGTECTSCPSAFSTSARGSNQLTDCVCERGYTGPNGGECASCEPGTFKSVLGPSQCRECRVGSWLNTSAGTTCNDCSAFSTTMAPGSIERSSCLCTPGYSGQDGGPCTACVAGSYKASNGSAACQTCGAFSTTSAEAAVDAQACTCVPGYSGPNGGASCASCPANTWCPGGTGRFACTRNSSSPAQSSSRSACVCDPRYFGPAWSSTGTCSFCTANDYCPGGNISFPCQTNAVSNAGSARQLDCVCGSGFSLLFDLTCAVLQPPTVRVIAGTAAGNGRYVGMARITLTRQANSNLTFAINNDTLSCANSVATTAESSFVYFDTTVLRTKSCALEGGESSVSEITYAIVEGATIVISFTLPAGNLPRGFENSLRRRLAIFYGMQFDQIRVVVRQNPQRRLLTNSVTATMVASDQSQFSELSTKSNDLDATALSNLVQAATGDTTLTASGVEIQVIEGALVAATTTTPAPEEDDDNGPGFDVGAVTAVSVICGLLLIGGALFGAKKYIEAKNNSRSMGDTAYMLEKPYYPYPGVTSAPVYPDVLPGYAPVYTPDPNYQAGPADLAFIPQEQLQQSYAVAPTVAPATVSNSPEFRQYLTAPSPAPMFPYTPAPMSSAPVEQYQPNLYPGQSQPPMMMSAAPMMMSAAPMQQLQPHGFPSGQPFQI